MIPSHSSRGLRVLPKTRIRRTTDPGLREYPQAPAWANFEISNLLKSLTAVSIAEAILPSEHGHRDTV
jgi:hypothetical protein